MAFCMALLRTSSAGSAENAASLVFAVNSASSQGPGRWEPNVMAPERPPPAPATDDRPQASVEVLGGGAETGGVQLQPSARRRRRTIHVKIWMKLTLFASLLGLVSAGVMALVLWKVAETNMQHELRLRIETVAKIRREQIQEYLASLQQKMRTIASRIIIGDALYSIQERRRPNFSNQSVVVDMSSAASASGFHSLGAYSLSGSRLFQSTNLMIYTLPDMLTSEEAHRNDTWISTPYPLGTELLVNITSPVVVQGYFVGTLFARLNADWFTDTLHDSTGLQSSGKLIAGYPTAGNSSIMLLVPPAGDPNRSSIQYAGPYALAIAGNTGFKRTKDYAGRQVASSYTPIGYDDWGLVVQEDASQAYRLIDNFETVIIVTMVVVFVIGVLTAFFLAKFLAHPLRGLSHTAKALARGDLQARAAQGGRVFEDEIDALRHVFNHMADQVSSSYNTLEQKVVERTRALAQANEGLESEIVRRSRIEGELEVAKNAAIAADKAKGEWMANMSHEIRTPLNGIINCTELCLDTDLDNEQTEYLELALFSAKHLLRLITDILDFSKIEAGKLDLEYIEFSLLDQMEHAVAVLAARAQKKGLDLGFQAEPAVPDVLVGDPGRLFQIFINLVGNSIKFTSKGEVIVAVAVSTPATAKDLVLQFSVHDTGIGIPKAKQVRLFQAFSQVDSSTSRLYGGTGLGLVISSKLAAAMDGRMWVESEEGRGSTFHFTARFLLPSPTSTFHRTGLFSPMSLEPLAGLRALVVDSSRAMCRVVLDLLGRWGIVTEHATSRADAVRALESAAAAGRPWNLLVLSLWLAAPGAEEADGSEATQLMRVIRRKPHLLVKAFTPAPQDPACDPPLFSPPRGGAEPGGSGGGGDGGSPLPRGANASPGDVVWPEQLKVPKSPWRGGPGGSRRSNLVRQQSSDFWPDPDGRTGSPGGGGGGRHSGVASPSRSMRRAPSFDKSDLFGSGLASPTASNTASPAGLAPRLTLEDLEGVRQGLADGTSVVERDFWLRSPVVMLVSLDQADADRCQQMGIQSHVAKPVKRTLLLRAIRTAAGISSQLTPTSGSGGSRDMMALPESERRPLHVLVAEDNVINQRVALALLRKWGHTPVLANTGAEAVEKEAEEKFDIILMDVKMPVMDGLEATRMIRQREAKHGGKTPIVAMTANALSGDFDICIDAGMDAYISKPLSTSKLQMLLKLVASNQDLAAVSALTADSSAGTSPGR